jgi:hypothetical protein
MGPVAPWLTAQAFICFGIPAVIHWVTRDWVCAHRESANWWARSWASLWQWPRGWPAWSKSLFWGYLGYAMFQWVRGGGHIVFSFGRGGVPGGGGQAWPASPPANTAFWMFAYGVIVLASLYFLTARDDTGLDTPGDSFSRA